MDTIESGVRWMVSPTPKPFNCTNIEEWKTLWEAGINTTNGTNIGEALFHCESELTEAASEAWSNTTWAGIGLTALVLYSQRNRIYNAASALWGSKTFRDQLESYVKKAVIPTIGTALAAYLLLKDPENEELKRTIKLIQDNWQLYCLITTGTGTLAGTSISALINALNKEAKKQSQGPVSGKDGNEIIAKIQWSFEGSDKRLDTEALLGKTLMYIKLYADRFNAKATSQEDKDKIANGLEEYLTNNIAPRLPNQFSRPNMK
tara:strand:+ start:7482 stop:8267 length:786 start_codon:yes stop_codon:yes gene_type:complete